MRDMTDKAVDYAVAAWITIAMAVILGCTFSWWLYLPNYALAAWFGWRFITVMQQIHSSLDRKEL